MYELHDTFNDRLISSHRTLKAAVLAQRAHSSAVKSANGESSCIPTAITCGGDVVDDEQIWAIEDGITG